MTPEVGEDRVRFTPGAAGAGSARELPPLMVGLRGLPPADVRRGCFEAAPEPGLSNGAEPLLALTPELASADGSPETNIAAEIVFAEEATLSRNDERPEGRLDEL